ncbi:outer membrane lipid asymmetry maintenance protein MlaD [Coraliomargarita sp. SDUM461004]|uniref:Outer membrane lipid asymmetry maintenance protein MlaD n=1 Tax=Thalassobacterium sedimentorum TaxID=3041258 RepID=A0ABU1AIR7_9BACT|nr:outer membrane lipid asymmetry maintenance protein MlaD [Coraliomargarita sp. SDUM461004]MDQ8194668.1 outer membrane lipid asymmetry maintenance protein MlaD [Coraliomargarita sp. SDUM461004]
MKNRSIEFLVGCFVLVGLAAVLYLAIQVGSARFFGSDHYTITARFSSASGVNAGSRVEIAGVRVGTVKDVSLNERFDAIVTLELPKSLELDEDTIASVKTAGLIGDRYINLSPGGGMPMEPGYEIVDTESAMDIESLISRFALGGIDEKSE